MFKRIQADEYHKIYRLFCAIELFKVKQKVELNWF